MNMEYESNNDFEPMDIDLSSNSVNAMDVSYGEDVHELNRRNLESSNSTPFNDSYDLIKNEVNIEKYDVKRVKMLNRYTIVITILFAFISLISIQVFNTKCKEELDLTTLRNTIKNNIHGQQTAIEKFIESLKYKDDSKILVIYGGTGVGKTFMVSLMLNSLMNFTNIYHYTMPVFAKTFSTNLMHGLILCKSSTVIIDDIYSSDDETLKINIKKLLSKSKELRKVTTLILVYNCKSGKNGLLKDCDNNFQLSLEIKLKDIDVSKTFIQFEPLTEDSLIKCIQSELKGRIISENELTKIMKNFNVELDGCKGVHQKMKYYNIV